MLSQTLFALTLAGAATAFTPPGFQPASSQDLFVSFGEKAAVNGIDIPKADTANAPTVGTTSKLTGTYAIMMVDPDIPASIEGGPTGELLHWLQAGLVSADTATTIAGQQIFALTNSANTAAIASYIPPSPPGKIPLSHRYVQLLLNTTGNSSALDTLMQAGANRRNFDAVGVLSAAGLTPLCGNSFNVTNAEGLGGGNSTSGGGSNGTITSTILMTTTLPTATGGGGAPSPNMTISTGIPKATSNNGEVVRSGRVLAGLGALAAAMVIL